ncbi:hypothetical protein AB5I41_08130 [Sphingomonas sp. MMS24-JH45]
MLDIDNEAGSDTVAFTGLSAAGLRLLGSNEEGFLYADATVRPTGAIEGRLGNDTLRGDTGDRTSQVFFFDTALGLDFGNDRITNFGANDLLVTTSQIRDSDGDGIVTFGGNRVLDLPDGTTVNIRLVTALAFDGSETVNGVTYYTYSLMGAPSTDQITTGHRLLRCRTGRRGNVVSPTRTPHCTMHVRR